MGVCILIAQFALNKGNYFGLDSAIYAIADFIIVFVIVDLVRYLVHLSMHKVQLLWFFHGIHHSDESFNITAAFGVSIIEFFY